MLSFWTALGARVQTWPSPAHPAVAESGGSRVTATMEGISGAMTCTPFQPLYCLSQRERSCVSLTARRSILLCLHPRWTATATVLESRLADLNNDSKIDAADLVLLWALSLQVP